MGNTNTLFHLLADADRRRILFSLCDTESIQLPDAILPRSQARPRQPEEGHPDSRPGIHSNSEARSRQQLELHLYHKHLPKLRRAGVIEWSQDTLTVSRGPQFDDFEPALRLLAANKRRFPDGLL